LPLHFALRKHERKQMCDLAHTKQAIRSFPLVRNAGVGCQHSAGKNHIPTKIAERLFSCDGVKTCVFMDDSTELRGGALSWLGCMLLAPIAWANRVWALPFLTVLCPSERF
jgi:hypothetical protein